MNINTSKPQINFGWSCETHRVIMDTALQDMLQFAKFKDKLEHFVQQPDHDDVGFLANKHFYFGEKDKPQEDIFFKVSSEKDENNEKNITEEKSTSKGLIGVFNKIMNKNAASYMDYNGKNNAKAAYLEHLDKIDNAIEDEDIDIAIENAGRACHFLQDVAQPQHIEETSTIGKAIDLKIHTDFEDFAEKHANDFANEFQADITSKRHNLQLFQDTFTQTKDTGKITRKNEPNWNEIGQKQFNIAVQATKEFLQNISIQMGLGNQTSSAEEEEISSADETTV